MNEPICSGPLPEQHRLALKSLFDTEGEMFVLRTIGVSRTALYRALAGLRLHATTRIAISSGLTNR